VEKKKTRQGIDNTDVMPILDESKFCSSVFWLCVFGLMWNVCADITKRKL
jgi:hypothetical protein